MPPQIPEVSWDGRDLIINAENSTLSDVLAAVRARTGAVIEIPSSAGAERVAVRIGPAPMRDVLSTLLYGTNFDYIIQASNTDEFAVQSVILSPRGKTDEVLANTHPATAGIRRMIGYGSPKRAYEASVESAAENAPAAEPTTAEAAPAVDPGPPADSTASNSQPPASTDSSAPAVQTAEIGSGAEVGAPVPNTLISPANIGEAKVSTSSTSAIVTDMQRLYEQRRQIQMQQNQAQQHPNQNPAPQTN